MRQGGENGDRQNPKLSLLCASCLMVTVDHRGKRIGGAL